MFIRGRIGQHTPKRSDNQIIGYLVQSLSKARSCAGAAIAFIENALMLYNGQYFRKGTKRALDELGQLRLPFDLKTRILAVIQAETVEKIRAALTELFVLTDKYLQVPEKKELPSANNLRGTYEEMYSNWKNKMAEAADRDDVYSSFMNLLSLQYMFHEIAGCIAMDDVEIMDKFNHKKLEQNADVFDEALSNYLAEYEKVGICPKHFENVTAFVEDYNKNAESGAAQGGSMTGLKRGSVELLSHQEEWNKNAENVISELRQLLGNAAVDIQHIGSTAINSIYAKPIIDIVIGVRELNDILSYMKLLEEHGFVYRGEDVAGQMLFVMGDFEKDTRTHHIHAVKWNGTEWNNYINFRDYLNCHPDKAALYDACKKKLALKFSDDRNSYTAGKQEFIECLLKEAHVWRQRQDT